MKNKNIFDALSPIIPHAIRPPSESIASKGATSKFKLVYIYSKDKQDTPVWLKGLSMRFPEMEFYAGL